MTENPIDIRIAWSRYWSSGRTESCPEEMESGGLAALVAGWRAFFSRLQEGAKALDLATGGGDVIRIALGTGRHFEIHGVDLADLSAVGRTLRAPSIHLLGNVDLSSLPFADASFHGVTSQFGVEYADPEAATFEAARVLVPSGQGLFFVHHAESEITRAAAARLAAYRAAFEGSAAFQCARTVFELYVQPAGGARILEAEARFRMAVAELRRRVSDDPASATARDILSFLMDLARSPRRYVASDALRRIDAADDEIRAWALRQQAQVDAALNRAGIDRLMGFLAKAGASVDPPGEIRDLQSRVLAWRCAFHK